MRKQPIEQRFYPEHIELDQRSMGRIEAIRDFLEITSVLPPDRVADFLNAPEHTTGRPVYELVLEGTEEDFGLVFNQLGETFGTGTTIPGKESPAPTWRDRVRDVLNR